MYNVKISPAAKAVLEEYTQQCARDNGVECALRLLDAYDKTVALLEMTPYIGCARLRYVPEKYRVTKFWAHLWFVFQLYENEVKIDYIIDDRQNYGEFLH